MKCGASYNQSHILPRDKDILCDLEKGHRGDHNWKEIVGIAPGGFRYGWKR